MNRVCYFSPCFFLTEVKVAKRKWGGKGRAFRFCATDDVFDVTPFYACSRISPIAFRPHQKMKENRRGKKTGEGADRRKSTQNPPLGLSFFLLLLLYHEFESACVFAKNCCKMGERRWGGQENWGKKTTKYVAKWEIRREVRKTKEWSQWEMTVFLISFCIVSLARVVKEGSVFFSFKLNWLLKFSLLLWLFCFQ